ncbi:Alpha/Beta hydrolase protein [Chaetomium fimeti]|uniref:Carboxylic ester hydrolase n=1 Tax=Chaetomium fimeti TaxID=1854472 RepID=A0AAE0HB33_9PEZI|nr:Alpha/Beta hydrolase protein [Chaetomium fimeti]
MKLPSPLSLGALPILSLLTRLTTAATLTQITTPFGPNPRNVSFHLYTPDTLAATPPILVNPHWCHGTAEAAFAGSRWATLADAHGFVVIYPGSSPASAADQCWDVSSAETLTHDGGGDSLGIVSMVRWALEEFDADPERVFVTGVSSGGMMTQVLLGAYPDVFAAGAAFAGVPFGCFAPEGENAGEFGYWNGECATGEVTHAPEEWGGLVRAAYPGYEGWRPKVQIFHGTKDEVVSYVNHGEGVKLWTNVLGLSDAPVSVVPDTPLAGWTKSVYGPEGRFEAYSAEGVPHDIKVQEDTVMAFFELNCTSECFSWGQGTAPSGGQPNASSSPVRSSSTFSTATAPGATFTSTAAVTTTSTPVACETKTVQGGVPLWSQCGGMGYVGATACANGECTSYNEYYAQCVPTPAC